MKKRLNRFVSGFLVIIMAMGMATLGVAIEKHEKIAENPQPIKIGVPLPLSGALQSFGVMMKNSFEMARDKINHEGGVHGRPLELVYADDKGEVSEGQKAVTHLIRSGAVMLVGGYASDPTYAMAKRVEKLNKPFLICTASADKITQSRLKNVYRLNPPVSEYTKGLETFFIKELKPRSMAILFEDSMFGTNGAIRMMGFCQEKAIAIRSFIGYSTKRVDEPAYLRSLLAPLTLEPPDVVYMVSYLEDAVVLVKEIKKLKIPSLLCGGAGGFTQEAFAQKTGDAANGMITATLWSKCSNYPGANEYYQTYVATYGAEPDYHGVESYSALLVAVDALKRAPSLNSKDIRTALDDTYLMTPFGRVKFYNYEGFERQNTVRTLVLQLTDGQYQCIWPLDLATDTFKR